MAVPRTEIGLVTLLRLGVAPKEYTELIAEAEAGRDFSLLKISSRIWKRKFPREKKSPSAMYLVHLLKSTPPLESALSLRKLIKSLFAKRQNGWRTSFPKMTDCEGGGTKNL